MTKIDTKLRSNYAYNPQRKYLTPFPLPLLPLFNVEIRFQLSFAAPFRHAEKQTTLNRGKGGGQSVYFDADCLSFKENWDFFYCFFFIIFPYIGIFSRIVIVMKPIAIPMAY